MLVGLHLIPNLCLFCEYFRKYCNIYSLKMNFKERLWWLWYRYAWINPSFHNYDESSSDYDIAMVLLFLSIKKVWSYSHWRGSYFCWIYDIIPICFCLVFLFLMFLIILCRICHFKRYVSIYWLVVAHCTTMVINCSKYCYWRVYELH